ncbi:MAG: transcription elongation factor GreA [Coriobacteriaceae bacterium]|nr:transcription elongation factor GreA [Coriobacteriaceae bacterium]
MDVSQIVLTAEGRKKLVEELAWREGEKSQEIVEHIKEARAFGDLSENAEYDAAKEEQAKNAARIAEIQAILANARDAEDGAFGLTVSIGCTVTLVDEDGAVHEVTLVGTTETNSLEHRISNESPVGRAIIGHAKGDTVEVLIPSGKRRVYTITKISR